jgi:hypothetical protein
MNLDSRNKLNEVSIPIPIPKFESDLESFKFLRGFGHLTFMMSSDEPMQPVPRHTHSLKRRFTTAEDAALQHLVKTLGHRNWEQIAQVLPGRTARQCRERYENYLTEIVSTSPWTTADDERLARIANDCGHRWTEMAKYFPGRSANNLKNRWHKVLSKVRVWPWSARAEAAQSGGGPDFPDPSSDNWCPMEEDDLGSPSDDISAL